ncbi:hypothetical protein ACHAWF_018137 [Thalassiosira exigua]
MEDSRAERIYVGGLDPSRGLSVELVASRLCSVDGVEVLSVNDVAFNAGKGSTHGESVYQSKRKEVDERGDLVDNRNFFFLEARVSATSGPPVVSALDLLAKQYNGVKWKGCRMRVEKAKPHFLKRLEEERELRAEVNERGDELIADALDRPKGEEDVKQRRRLRIRKRFGEEAFNVDTRPYPIELSQRANRDEDDGWGNFAALVERLKHKRQSQHGKLMERRKKERTLWASGKGKGNANPASESDVLRSLVFLNRGIHIRFVGELDRDTVKEEDVAEPESMNDAQEGNLSTTSSSVVSSDSEQSSDRHVEVGGGGSYVWSDDDIDDISEDNQSEVSSEKSDEEESKYEAKNTLGDSNETKHQFLASKREGMKEVMDATVYTKAAAADEFAGGVDFGGALQHNVDDAFDMENDGQVDSDGDDASEYCLEDEIRANIGALSMLFPNENFDQRPLATSIASSDAADASKNGIGDKVGSDKNLSSTSGPGLILQRYDPTKESDRRYELHHSDQNQKVDDTDLTTVEVQDEEKSSFEDAALSTKISEEDKMPEQREKLEEPEIPANREPSDIENEHSKTTSNVERKNVPSTAIYEQNKLEDVFRQAREGNPEPFSIANLFQGAHIQAGDKEESTKGCVYKQDKLEDVFKQARGDNASEAGTGESQFSFGFGASNAFEKQKDGTSFNKDQDVRSREESNSDQYPPTIKVEDEPKKGQVKKTRLRRMGMRFPESDLDKYEDMFFGLNEGKQILEDHLSMKDNEENQGQWQKERAVLTADWKRKQKSAISRRAKRKRGA